MEKSHVSMYCCLICDDAIGVLLDTRLRDALPPKMTDAAAICDHCKIFLEKGVLIYEPDTGNRAIIADKAFERILNIPIPEGKVCFAEAGLLRKLGVFK